MEERMHLPKIGIEAQYMRWELVEPSGIIVAEGEQHNLVLTNASELMATYGLDGITNFAVVGTGSTSPNIAQTALTSELARTNVILNGEADSISRIANGVYDVRRVREFSAVQVGNQNLTEWGFSPIGTSGANVAVRELFRSAGVPITITPTAVESLRIIYVTRVTLGPVAPQNVNINIAGVGVRSGVFRIFGGLTDHSNNAGHIDFKGLSALISGNASDVKHSLGLSNTFGAYGDFPPTSTAVKNATIAAYTANSKTRGTNTVQFSTIERNHVVNFFGLANNSGRIFAAIILDSGQEFTKNSLHTLDINPFLVSWT
jgi:hypothetical protein